jgi:hypothetical protein
VQLTVAQSLAPRVAKPPGVRDKRTDMPPMFLLGPDQQVVTVASEEIARELLQRELVHEFESRARDEALQLERTMRVEASTAGEREAAAYDVAARDATDGREPQSQQIQAREAAEAERWNDLAAYEASRRVARAESEIEKIVDRAGTELGESDLRKIEQWVEYASAEEHMVGGLRRPSEGNGRATAHYAPQVQDLQGRIRDDFTRAKAGATAESDGPNPLLAIMEEAVATGKGLTSDLDQGLDHEFVVPFQPTKPPTGP